MYLGSVKFFKHLIISVIILLILVPTVLATVFIIKYNKLSSSFPTASTITEPQKEPTPQELVKKLTDSKLTEKDILKLFAENNMTFRDIVFREYYSVDNDELAYQKKYPDLYVDTPQSFKSDDNTVYLTFDDGPSIYTGNILSILDKYDVKATFFVVGNENPGEKKYLKEIAARGHTIGIHSYSHDYNKIYNSVDDYLDDFYKAFTYVYEETGIKPTIYRFPGGSINAYNQTIYKQIIAEMSRRGFVYYDWNVSGEDAAQNASWTSIYNNVLKSLEGKSRAVVLLHDGNARYATITTIDDLIKAVRQKGYRFDKLTNGDKPITFGYID